MNESQYCEWKAIVDRPAAGSAIIDSIRMNPPGRNVRGQFSNMTGVFQSKKMGCEIKSESNTGEWCFIRECEVSDDVLEFYDQPTEQIKISWTDKNGRNHGIWSTADFFVLRRDGTAGWVEVKPESTLQESSAKSNRYTRRDDGSWSCPSGEEFAERSGLFYEIHSTAQFNQILQRNIEYLIDYLKESPDVAADKKRAISQLVATQEGISLADIFGHEGEFTRADVLKMITYGELYVDLHHHVLARHATVPVFTDSVMSEVYLDNPAQEGWPQEGRPFQIAEGAMISFDKRKYEIFQVSNDIWLKNSEGKVITFSPESFQQLIKKGAITATEDVSSQNAAIKAILDSRSEMEFGSAIERMHTHIAPWLNKTSRQTPSTARYWLKKYRDAEISCGNGFIGLFDNIKERGNHDPKLPKRVKELIHEVINEVFLTKTNINLTGAYAVYENRCEEEGIIAASKRTFCGVHATLNRVDETNIRKGKKAAYQIHITYWYLEIATPRHGDRPFEVVHIDHTELEIEIYDPKSRKSLGRPWLTLMIDANTRRVLAAYLSFESPSTRSVMMVLRECVRRFQQIPQTLILDNGKEFHSRYLTRVRSYYEINVKYRPPAQARFGSVQERIFGTTNTVFIHSLLGNTKDMKDPRSVSSSHLPSNNAVWTFESFEPRLKKFLYEIYDQNEHPALFESPRTAFERGLFEHGLRMARFVAYDETFLMMTRPTTTKGEAKVIPAKGVKINNIFYWCDAFRSRVIERTQVKVRYDPFNIGIAYAYVNGSWQLCRSPEYFAELNGLTECEVKKISALLLKRCTLLNRKYQFSPKILRDFIRETKDEEMILLMRKRDTEGRYYEQAEDVEHAATENAVDGSTREQGKGTLVYDPSAIKILDDL